MSEINSGSIHIQDRSTETRSRSRALIFGWLRTASLAGSALLGSLVYISGREGLTRLEIINNDFLIGFIPTLTGAAVFCATFAYFNIKLNKYENKKLNNPLHFLPNNQLNLNNLSDASVTDRTAATPLCHTVNTIESTV